MRLVDAEALMIELYKAGFEHFKAGGCHPGDGAIPVAEAAQICKDAPTIDAVPVVLAGIEIAAEVAGAVGILLVCR